MAIPDLHLAMELTEGGKPEEALSLLTAWALEMPTYAAVHVALACAYEAAGRWGEARQAWRHAHFLMPNSPAVLEGLAHRPGAETLATEVEERLVMDLDLEAELEATLEALFNPFTLPQQHEGGFDEDDLDDEGDAGAREQVAAALAVEAEAMGDVAAPDASGTAEEESTDDEAFATAAADVQALPEADEAPEARAGEAEPADQALEERLAEGQKAIEAFEEMADRTVEEETNAVLEDWNDFETEATAPSATAPADVDDLDRLINELESARIVPKPDLGNLPETDADLDFDDDIEDVVTETLARIYANQAKYSEAARVYEQLAEQHPAEADRFDELAAAMYARAEGGARRDLPDDKS